MLAVHDCHGQLVELRSGKIKRSPHCGDLFRSGWGKLIRLLEFLVLQFLQKLGDRLKHRRLFLLQPKCLD